MTRTIGRLTALRVDREKRPGLYCDGGGLYLRLTSVGSKHWVFRFMLNGRARWMGLGPLHTISLADARARAAECRKQRLDGVDPIDNRRATKQKALLEAGRAVIFRQCAEAYIKSHEAGWRNAKHSAQWSATLATYAEPVLGALSVQSIDTAEIMRVLEPIWAIKPETASRLRGRIEAVLDWAKVRAYRQGENPARWRGHLDKLLPARNKVRRVKHHAALPYDDLPIFIAALRSQEGTAARALEFTILTAARTSEVLGAKWGELDIAGKIWTIPNERMKAGKEHRVPLSSRAVDILLDLAPERSAATALVFEGVRAGQPLSNMSMSMTLRRMKRDDLTVHGFRSSFRDWTAERTNFPNEVAEMALAHAVGDKVEAAYRRGDLFSRRRRMMDDWGSFCEAAGRDQRGNVATLRAKK
jgi:integrase